MSSRTISFYIISFFGYKEHGPGLFMSWIIKEHSSVFSPYILWHPCGLSESSCLLLWSYLCLRFLTFLTELTYRLFFFKSTYIKYKKNHPGNNCNILRPVHFIKTIWLHLRPKTISKGRAMLQSICLFLKFKAVGLWFVLRQKDKHERKCFIHKDI